MSENQNQRKPENLLPWAILTTILCCLPTGIVAIVYATKVDGLWSAGNYQEAENAAKNARLWTFISLGVGLISIFLYFILFLIASLAG